MRYALLAIIIADILAANFYEVLSIDPWYAMEVSYNVRLFAVWCFVSCIIPYSRLMLKSLAFIYALTYSWDACQIAFVDESNLVFASAINVLIFLPWLFMVKYRSYDVGCDPLISNRIYWVTHKPDSFVGFLLSLFGNPIGGSGVMFGGIVHIYHRGVFKKIDADRMPESTIYIDSGINLNNNIREYVNGFVGKDWHFYRNCLTMQRGIRARAAN